jgi:hypothetical protein
MTLAFADDCAKALGATTLFLPSLPLSKLRYPCGPNNCAHEYTRFATTKWRGAMMGSVFAMQGFGQLGGALVMLFVTMGFKESLINVKTFAQCTGVCGLAVDKMWRTLIGKSLSTLLGYQLPSLTDLP